MSSVISNNSGPSVFVPLVQTGPDGYGGVTSVGGGEAVGVRGGDGLAVAGVIVGSVWGCGYEWWLRVQQRVVSVAYGVLYLIVLAVCAFVGSNVCASVDTPELVEAGPVHVVLSLVSLTSVAYLNAFNLLACTCFSVFGLSCVTFGVSYSVVFLTLHEVVGRRPTLKRAVLRAGVGASLGTVFYYIVSFGGVMFGGKGAIGVIYSVFHGVTSAWLGYPSLVRMVHRKHGDFGVVVMVVVHSVFSVFGVLGIGVSRLLLTRIRVDTCGIIEDSVEVEKVENGCSERVSDLSRVFSLDLSRLCRVMSEKDLNFVGTVAQGACERMDVRRLALVGDRCMSLAVALRASREGWSVGEASDVSQALVTNAAFATWFDKKLFSLFPQMLGRAEKRKGTLVECLVGIAWVTGCSTNDIETFVFDNVAGALGRQYNERGECVFLI